jgi:hypothetical protein
MNTQIVDRGTLYTTTIGDLVVTYLSGKDADRDSPVVTMSIGEVALKNVGARPINVQYNYTNTGYVGHRFTFGPRALEEMDPPGSPSTTAASFVDHDIAPGEVHLISRQDLMAKYYEKGRDGLRDGTICTRYAAALLIDGQSVSLRFGPHCFHVAMDRDWDREYEEYVQYFLARDKAALGG